MTIHSDIYRALRKPGEANYAYNMGAVFGAICARYGDKITATVMGNISMRPDLMRTYLRHLDLAEYDIPAKPDAWRQGAEAQTSFWRGYYHSRSQGRLPQRHTPCTGEVVQMPTPPAPARE